MKRYFTTEREDTSTVKVKAIKRGTISGRYGIFHMDPEGRDPRARSRTVPAAVAEELKLKGIVEFSGGSGSAATSGNSVPGDTVHGVAASRRQTSIDKNDVDERQTEYFGASGADTRDTTAFESDPSKSARVAPHRVIRLGEPREPDPELEDEADDQESEEGDDAIESESEPAAAAVPATPADEAMSAEGDASGGDRPPVGDDVEDHAGSDQGAGNDARDDTGAATDATDDQTKVAAVEATPPAAPAPRRRAARSE